MADEKSGCSCGGKCKGGHASHSTSHKVRGTMGVAPAGRKELGLRGQAKEK
ncbi:MULTISPECIES: hypothetical protein [Winkia]|uniref:50S ribosomal protein L32 n=1 Tax=Winkia neuii subsp. anitrata TaxID=29318 RepID=A0AB38XLY3_9ACTO|nr:MULTISPECIES: hypothetical protein [Winkia]MDK7162424.1 hypothetical protein [Winkia sp. UMB3105]MDK8594341.1 hypothetical protein [Winkia sp. UMB1096A]MDU2269002.1 hypothetical protein [Winkia neuii]WCE45348.1 hypothetical protein PIG85_06670 [Winkia neuii subsp. anitrata]WEB56189.1 hypothetical protein PUW65_06330 [Winkia neuii]